MEVYGIATCDVMYHTVSYHIVLYHCTATRTFKPIDFNSMETKKADFHFLFLFSSVVEMSSSSQSDYLCSHGDTLCGELDSNPRHWLLYKSTTCSSEPGDEQT